LKFANNVKVKNPSKRHEDQSSNYIHSSSPNNMLDQRKTETENMHINQWEQDFLLELDLEDC